MALSTAMPLPEAENDEQPLPNIFYKTAMCKYFLRKRCTKGEGCKFAHTTAELRPCLDLSRTRMCPVLCKLGRCGDYTCRFAHSHKQLRAIEVPMEPLPTKPTRPDTIPEAAQDAALMMPFAAHPPAKFAASPPAEMQPVSRPSMREVAALNPFNAMPFNAMPELNGRTPLRQPRLGSAGLALPAAEAVPAVQPATGKKPSCQEMISVLLKAFHEQLSVRAAEERYTAPVGRTPNVGSNVGFWEGDTAPMGTTPNVGPNVGFWEGDTAPVKSRTNVCYWEGDTARMGSKTNAGPTMGYWEGDTTRYWEGVQDSAMDSVPVDNRWNAAAAAGYLPGSRGHGSGPPFRAIDGRAWASDSGLGMELLSRPPMQQAHQRVNRNP